MKKYISVVTKGANMSRMYENALILNVMDNEKNPKKYFKGPNDGNKSSMLAFRAYYTESYKDKDGNWKNSAHTDYYDVVVYGEKADELNDVIQHNMKLRGKFQYVRREWEDDKGEKHYSYNHVLNGIINILQVAGEKDLVAWGNKHNVRVFSGNLSNDMNAEGEF